MTQEDPKVVGYDGFGAPIYDHQVEERPRLEPTSHWLTIADIQDQLDEVDNLVAMLAEAMATPYTDDDRPLCERRIPERGQE